MTLSPTTKRLLREAKELSPHSPNPNPHFHAAPVSDADLFEWHFTILGPPSTPYENGIYHGRIVLPNQYPLRPPSFRFLTPSGRFEVNREICLSISGHHEETWQPAWGIRTALTAIRAFMSGGSSGQIGGLEASEATRKEWATKSRTWRCGSCGGKSNEDILKEWANDVHEAGGSFGEETGDGPLPEGLSVGYKDEMRGNRRKEIRDTAEATANSNYTAASGDDLERMYRAHRDASSADPSSSFISAPSTAAQPTASQPAQQIPSPTSSQPAAQNTPQTPSPTTSSPQVRLQPRTSNNGSASWIDRAIAGVFLALLFMLLRKIYAPYS